LVDTMPRPYCFVLMPFGQKRDASGTTVDCDAVYRDVIHPAIDAAELEPIRADEEQVCERSSSNVAPVRHARTR
jgi:hypothetical protein